MVFENVIDGVGSTNDVDSHGTASGVIRDGSGDTSTELTLLWADL
jgi:hypothetical protein